VKTFCRFYFDVSLASQFSRTVQARHAKKLINLEEMLKENFLHAGYHSWSSV